MVVLTGKFDGKNFVPDRPPDNLPINTPVQILVDLPAKTGPFDAIIGIAGDAELPPDFAAQHEHYTKGTPKR